jgi:hypothetical protein
VWEDLKVEAELGIKHRDAWERIAVVSDLSWLWRAFELFSWMVPGEMRFVPRERVRAGQDLAGGVGKAGCPSSCRERPKRVEALAGDCCFGDQWSRPARLLVVQRGNVYPSSAA